MRSSKLDENPVEVPPYPDLRSISAESRTDPPRIIPFEKELLNEGGHFNVTKGDFRPPVSGIYHFQVSASSGFHVEDLGIRLIVNGQRVACGYTWQRKTASPQSVSFGVSLHLRKRSQVSLINSVGDLYEGAYGPTTFFTGWLVKEDLAKIGSE